MSPKQLDVGRHVEKPHSQHPHTLSSRALDRPARTPKGTSTDHPRARLPSPPCEGPNPNFRTSYLPLSRSSILPSSYSSYISSSHRADNTYLAHHPHPSRIPRSASSSPSTEISSFLLRRIIYRFPANYDRASIAFFSVSPTRPALPLLAVTFSPSKDSRRGSSRGITAHNSLTTS